MEEITMDQFYLLSQNLAKENEANFNYLKLAEEMAELSELLLKKVNKAPTHQPSNESLVEEAGDVYVRLNVLVDMLGDEAVKRRVLEKGTKLWNAREELKYRGHV